MPPEAPGALGRRRRAAPAPPCPARRRGSRGRDALDLGAGDPAGAQGTAGPSGIAAASVATPCPTANSRASRYWRSATRSSQSVEVAPAPLSLGMNGTGESTTSSAWNAYASSLSSSSAGGRRFTRKTETERAPAGMESMGMVPVGTERRRRSSRPRGGPPVDRPHGEGDDEATAARDRRLDRAGRRGRELEVQRLDALRAHPVLGVFVRDLRAPELPRRGRPCPSSGSPPSAPSPEGDRLAR